MGDKVPIYGDVVTATPVNPESVNYIQGSNQEESSGENRKDRQPVRKEEEQPS